MAKSFDGREWEPIRAMPAPIMPTGREGGRNKGSPGISGESN